jgi:tripartite-type tricarboxylate transporter receptor subunit TctC
MTRTFRGALLGGLLAASTGAAAQDWPTRPVTMVVPFAAGGGLDVAARNLAQRIGEVLGQSVVIENVGGAGGMIGSARVAKAPPDGYTFVFGNSGTHAANQTLYKKPLYDAAADFEPVILFIELPRVMSVRKDLPVSNLQEFIAYAKANHAKMQFGSAGIGSASHVGCVLLNQAIGVEVTHLPFRGSGIAMQELVAGRHDYMCEVISTSMSQIQGDTVKPIAMMSLQRSKVLPNVPTAHEQGLKDFDASAWYGFFLPKGTPEPIVRKLNAAVSQTLDTAAIRERLEGLGMSIVAPERRSPDYLAGFVKREIVKWAGPIKAANITGE